MGLRDSTMRSRRLALAAAALALLGPSAARPEEPAASPAGAEGALVPGPAGEVAFDHQVHAGQFKMPCLDCHVFADKSPVAGLPSGRKCLGCHKFVKEDREHPENTARIKIMLDRLDAGQPLRWVRVFAVPDFIYFSHRVHVAAKVDCKECHGDVATEKVVRQDRPFTMGRCLKCHEERRASRECLACHK